MFLILFIVPLLLSKPIRKLFAKPDVRFNDEYMFDDFVCNDFFVEEKYEKLYPLNITIVLENSLFPELRFKQISSNYAFFIKTKYQSQTDTREIEYCTEKEFLFLQSEIDISIYILIGIGGPANFPDTLYLIPYKDTTSNKLILKSLDRYSVSHNNEVVFSNNY